MELVTQVFITWLSLKWLVAALVLEAEWSWVWEIPLVLTTWNCGIAQGSGGIRPRILLTTLWTERLPMQKSNKVKQIAWINHVFALIMANTSYMIWFMCAKKQTYFLPPFSIANICTVQCNIYVWYIFRKVELCREYIAVFSVLEPGLTKWKGRVS